MAAAAIKHGAAAQEAVLKGTGISETAAASSAQSSSALRVFSSFSRKITAVVRATTEPTVAKAVPARKATGGVVGPPPPKPAVAPRALVTTGPADGVTAEAQGRHGVNEARGRELVVGYGAISVEMEVMPRPEALQNGEREP